MKKVFPVLLSLCAAVVPQLSHATPGAVTTEFGGHFQMVSDDICGANNKLLSLEAISDDSLQSTLTNIFLALYPDYRSTTESTCSFRGLDGDLSESNTQFVFYSSLGRKLSLVQVVIDEDDAANAYALDAERSASGMAEIVITRGMLELAKNQASLAFVIAHEMAHLQLDHFAPDFSLIILTAEQQERVRKVHEQWELDADRRAAALLQRVGYNGQDVIGFLRTIGSCKERTSNNAFAAHPELEQRVQSVELALSDEIPLG